MTREGPLPPTLAMPDRHVLRTLKLAGRLVFFWASVACKHELRCCGETNQQICSLHVLEAWCGVVGIFFPASYDTRWPQTLAIPDGRQTHLPTVGGVLGTESDPFFGESHGSCQNDVVVHK